MTRYLAAAALSICLLVAIVFAWSLSPWRSLANFAIAVAFGSPGTQRPNVVQPLTPDVMARCARARANETPVEPYWSAETFGGPSGAFIAAWYSTQLCAMGEPPLAIPPAATLVLRFVWLRSFHPAIAVRVERVGPDARLYAVELSGAGGYEPGLPARRQERSLSDVDWEVLANLVEQSDFWLLPVTEPGFGLDGATWLLEISERHRYHLVDRWSGGELEDVGRQLLALSGLEPDPIY